MIWSVFLAGISLGLLVGLCLSRGIDSAELTAYRRIARMTPDEIEQRLGA